MDTPPRPGYDAAPTMDIDRPRILEIVRLDFPDVEGFRREDVARVSARGWSAPAWRDAREELAWFVARALADATGAVLRADPLEVELARVVVPAQEIAEAALEGCSLLLVFDTLAGLLRVPRPPTPAAPPPPPVIRERAIPDGLPSFPDPLPAELLHWAVAEDLSRADYEALVDRYVRALRAHPRPDRRLWLTNGERGPSPRELVRWMARGDLYAMGLVSRFLEHELRRSE